MFFVRKTHGRRCADARAILCPCQRKSSKTQCSCGFRGFLIFASNPDYVYKITVFPSFSPTFRKEKVSTWCQNHKLNYLAHKYSANRNRKRRRNKAKPRFLLFLYVRIYVIFKRIAYLCDFSDFFRGLQNRVSRVRAFVPLPK